MSQDQIIDILGKMGPLTATQIIQEMKVDDEPKEFVRRVLKQMRKYHEISFICIAVCSDKSKLKIRYTDNENDVMKRTITHIIKKFPMLSDKIKQKKITKPCYLYFLPDYEK